MWCSTILVVTERSSRVMQSTARDGLWPHGWAESSNPTLLIEIADSYCSWLAKPSASIGDGTVFDSFGQVSVDAVRTQISPEPVARLTGKVTSNTIFHCPLLSRTEVSTTGLTVAVTSISLPPCDDEKSMPWLYRNVFYPLSNPTFLHRRASQQPFYRLGSSSKTSLFR